MTSKAKQLYAEVEDFATNLIREKCWKLVRKGHLSTHDADDLIHDLHIDLMERLEDYLPEKSPLEPYTRALVKNRIAEEFRKRGIARKYPYNRPASLTAKVKDDVEGELKLSDTIADPEDPKGRCAERRAMLHEALATMPQDLRDAFNLLTRMSKNKVAKRLGVARTHVYWLLDRMKAHLKAAGLAEEYPAIFKNTKSASRTYPEVDAATFQADFESEDGLDIRPARVRRLKEAIKKMDVDMRVTFELLLKCPAEEAAYRLGYELDELVDMREKIETYFEILGLDNEFMILLASSSKEREKILGAA